MFALQNLFHLNVLQLTLHADSDICAGTIGVHSIYNGIENQGDESDTLEVTE
jgi:hypothetical protein